MYCKTTAAWAYDSYHDRPPDKAASSAWTSSFDFPKENKDPEHVLVLGGDVGYEQMVSFSGSPRPDEGGAGWANAEPTRFGRLARRLWDGLLDHERIVDQ